MNRQSKFATTRNDVTNKMYKYTNVGLSQHESEIARSKEIARRTDKTGVANPKTSSKCDTHHAYGNKNVGLEKRDVLLGNRDSKLDKEYHTETHMTSSNRLGGVPMEGFRSYKQKGEPFVSSDFLTSGSSFNKKLGGESNHEQNQSYWSSVSFSSAPMMSKQCGAAKPDSSVEDLHMKVAFSPKEIDGMGKDAHYTSKSFNKSRKEFEDEQSKSDNSMKGLSHIENRVKELEDRQSRCENSMKGLSHIENRVKELEDRQSRRDKSFSDFSNNFALLIEEIKGIRSFYDNIKEDISHVKDNQTKHDKKFSEVLACLQDQLYRQRSDTSVSPVNSVEVLSEINGKIQHLSENIQRLQDKLDVSLTETKNLLEQQDKKRQEDFEILKKMISEVNKSAVGTTQNSKGVLTAEFRSDANRSLELEKNVQEPKRDSDAVKNCTQSTNRDMHLPSPDVSSTTKSFQESEYDRRNNTSYLPKGVRTQDSGSTWSSTKSIGPEYKEVVQHSTASQDVRRVDAPLAEKSTSNVNTSSSGEQKRILVNEQVPIPPSQPMVKSDKQNQDYHVDACHLSQGERIDDEIDSKSWRVREIRGTFGDVEVTWVRDGDVGSLEGRYLRALTPLIKSFDRISFMGMFFMSTPRVIDFRDWDVGREIFNKVCNYTKMFYGCKLLESVLFPYSVNHDGIACISMESTFEGCRSLKRVEFPCGFDFGKVTNGNFMFKDCTKLEEVKNLGMSPICSQEMFENCQSIRKLEFSNEINSETDLYATFKGCYSLETIKLKINGNRTRDEYLLGYEAFGGCTNLREIRPSSDPFKELLPVWFNKGRLSRI